VSDVEALPYGETDRAVWDDFVDRSRNATFLHHRDYMDYHGDRFPDASLVVRSRGRLVALLPATRRGTVLDSHAGLTFAGLLVDRTMTAARMLEVLEAVVAAARGAGCELLRYRAVPHIYHRGPTEEDLFALATRGAHLARRTAVAVLATDAAGPRQERRDRALR
jgi:hypothetical protein